MDEAEFVAALQQVNTVLDARLSLGLKGLFFTRPGVLNAKTRAAAEEFLKKGGLTPQAAAEQVFRRETGGHPLPPE